MIALDMPFPSIAQRYGGGSSGHDRDSRGVAIWNAVQSFYRTRDYRLAWVADGVLSPDAESVARIVAGRMKTAMRGA